MCFRESDGKFLWQLTHDKLAAGRVNDWPKQGICSSPCVEGNRLYYVSNRCELVCADVEGFLDGENDGPFTEETLTDTIDGDIIWKLDMIEELGVFPHNMASSSPAMDGDLVFVVTSNGVDESHIAIPAPDAPSFIAVNKNTGEVVWERNDPHEAHPARPVVEPGGRHDRRAEAGRSFPAATAGCTPSTRIRRPALVVSRQSGRHGLQAGRAGHAERDHRHAGDPRGPRLRLSRPGPGARGRPRPSVRHRRHEAAAIITKTGALWHNSEVNRAMSTVAIHDGILYHCDLSGIFRAIDARRAARCCGSTIWRRPSGVRPTTWTARSSWATRTAAGGLPGGPGEEDPEHDRHGRAPCTPRPWRPTACST